jgi:TfoX/Sxy family transcriptional regulator of competence genes
MAYDEKLAQRVRALIGAQPGLSEKKMFGGISFLVNGNLACGVIGEELILRVKHEETAQVLSQPHTRVFDMTGKPMKGWVVILPQGLDEADDLRRWVMRGVEYAAALPKK